MLSGENDLLNQFKIQNDMKEFGEFDMTKYTFVPFIKMYLNKPYLNAYFDIIADEYKFDNT
jgi:hypothetical protein